MEEIKQKYITNRYENDKFIKLFFEKFSKERNKIFQYIYDLLELQIILKMKTYLFKI